MKLKLTSILALLFLAFQVPAQSIIKGKIVDTESNEPLIAANITFKQDGKYVTGATSDFDGIYTAQLEPGVYTIEYTYIGYQKESILDYEIEKNKPTELNMEMFAGILIEEVVIVGYTAQIKCQLISCGGRVSCTHGCCMDQTLEEEIKEKINQENPALEQNILNVTIYPNPASSYAMIEAEKPFDAIKIMSADGKLVHYENNIHQTKKEVSLDGWTAGMYFVYYSFGEQTAIERLVVSKR